MPGGPESLVAAASFMLNQHNVSISSSRITDDVVEKEDRGRRKGGVDDNSNGNDDVYGNQQQPQQGEDDEGDDGEDDEDDGLDDDEDMDDDEEYEHPQSRHNHNHRRSGSGGGAGGGGAHDDVLQHSVFVHPSAGNKRARIEADSAVPDFLNASSASKPVTKRARTQRACDPCRKKRIKCSGEQPCTGCRGYPDGCHYSPLVKKRAPVVRKNKLGGVENRLRMVEMILEKLAPNCFNDGWLESQPPALKQSAWDEAPPAPQLKRLPPPTISRREPTPPAPQQVLPPTLPPLSQQIDERRSNPPPMLSITPTALSPSPSINPQGATESRMSLSPNPFQYQPHTPVPQEASSWQAPSYEGGMIAGREGTNLCFFGATSALGGHSNSMFKTRSNWSNGILHISGRETNFFRSTAKPGVPIATVFPFPIDVVTHLINQYFQKFHPEFPMLDEEMFRAELNDFLGRKEIVEDDHWHFMLLLYSMLTLMAQFVASLASFGGLDAEKFAKECLALAKKTLSDRLEETHIATAQSLIMLSMSAAGRQGRATSTWTYVGMAARKAQELGLHREMRLLGISHPNLTMKHMEERRRTWYCIMIAEVIVSLMMGRPLSVDANDWDTDLPQKVNEDVGNLLHHIELMGIVGGISRYANRTRSANRDVFIADTQRRLSKWYNGLDPSWRSGNLGSTWSVKGSMMLMYHSACILFQRTAYSCVEDSICISAATSIVRLLDNYPVVKPDSPVASVILPSFSYSVMMAASVCVAKIVNDPKLPPSISKPPMPNAKAFLRRCLYVFDNIRSVSMPVGRFWHVISLFLECKGIKLDTIAVLEGAEVDVKANMSNSRSNSDLHIKAEPRMGSNPMNASASPLINGSLSDLGRADSTTLFNPLTELEAMQGMWDVNFFELAGLSGLVDLNSLIPATTSSLLAPPAIELPKPNLTHQRASSNNSEALGAAATGPPIISPAASQFPPPVTSMPPTQHLTRPPTSSSVPTGSSQGHVNGLAPLPAQYVGGGGATQQQHPRSYPTQQPSQQAPPMHHHTSHYPHPQQQHYGQPPPHTYMGAYPVAMNGVRPGFAPMGMPQQQQIYASPVHDMRQANASPQQQPSAAYLQQGQQQQPPPPQFVQYTYPRQ